jgi:hypothetical protein
MAIRAEQNRHPFAKPVSFSDVVTPVILELAQALLLLSDLCV